MRSLRAGSTICVHKYANARSNAGVWNSIKTGINHPKSRAMVRSTARSQSSAYREAWIPRQEMKSAQGPGAGR